MHAIIRDIQTTQPVINRLHEGCRSTEIEVVIRKWQMCLEQLNIYTAGCFITAFVVETCLSQHADIMDRALSAFDKFGDFTVKGPFRERP